MNKTERNQIIAESTAPVQDLARQFNLSDQSIYRIKREWSAQDNGAQPQPEPEAFNARRANNKLLFDQHATSGLTRYGGMIEEEFQRELRGDGGIKLYTQMAMHPVAAAVLFGISMAQRQVNWFAEPASDDATDVEASEFLEQCMQDMSQTWDDVISETFTMLEYGFAICEQVYKRRLGQKPGKYTEDPARSRFDDGRIGWRRWQYISPNSLAVGDRWIYDENGRVQGFRQQAAPLYQTVTVPMEKALLFRTITRWDNPEGRSILRPMYQSWYYADNLAEIEAIAAERMGTGIPAIYMGNDLSKSNDADSDWSYAVDVSRNVRTDEQMGLVFPGPKMGAGAPEGTGWLFELVSPPSRGIIDFNQLIDRHEKRMAMTVLGQSIFLGMQNVGTQALYGDAQDVFQMSISAWSDSVADVINRFAVPRLFALNPFNLEELPQIGHSDTGVPDFAGIADFINKLVGAQVLTPDGQLETYVRELAKLPEQEDQAIEITESEEGPEEDLELEEPEDETEIEQSSEFFAKTIKGALARDEETGKFTRGSGPALSDRQIAIGDALAFGKMDKEQQTDFQKAGLVAQKDGKTAYTEQGKAISRKLRSSPHQGMKELLQVLAKAGIKAGSIGKGGGKKKKGGGGGAAAKRKAKRATVAKKLESKGVTTDKLDALDSIKVGDEVDEETLQGLQDQGLADVDDEGTVTLTGPGRSLLSASNAGDVDRALKIMAGLEESSESASFFSWFELQDLSLHSLIDEEFALRLRRGGPKWERATNAYEMQLRREYQSWSDDVAAELVNAESDDVESILRERVDELIALLILLGRRRLPQAQQLGLADSPATAEGYGELGEALTSNERFLTDSLGPGIVRKVLDRVRSEPLILTDEQAMGSLLGTFVARIGSYSGAFWTMIMRGFIDRIRQKPEQNRVRWVLDPKAQHCPDCPRFAGTYDNQEMMLAQTGGALPSHNVQCDGNCRCHLEEEVKPGVWRRT